MGTGFPQAIRGFGPKLQGTHRSANCDAERMSNVFDIYTIIFLALAVFIFLRLRSVLGQRTGRERPPYDPYSAHEPARPPPEKVVALPNRTPDAAAQTPAAPAEPVERWKGITEPGSPVATGLDAI